ncbi:MAG: transglutaminase domain-containing protein, partial [Desulfobacteraceae bacterium]
DGYIIQEEIFLKIDLMGLASGVYAMTRCRVDQDFGLRRFQFKMTSGALSYEAAGRVEEGRLTIETGRKGEKRTRRIPIEEPPILAASLAHYFSGRPLRVGDAFQFPIFDPSTMSRKKAEVRVVAREEVEIRGIAYKAFRLETELWGTILTFWLDENGGTLKETGFMGLTAVRSSAAVAPENIQGSGETDFYDLSAVKPDRKLPRPRDLSYLKVRFGGIEDVPMGREVWNGGRQRFSESVMVVEREELQSIPADRENDAGMEKAFENELAPDFNIESDHQEIVQAARTIVDEEQDPLRMAQLVLSWVYENLEKRPVVTIPSALEVLRSKVGDCNEHATLTTALLRALGIPTRIAVGLVYLRGRFFYHAWNEVYVGQWVSLDATLNQMPVDATHMKLLEGNLEKQVDVIGLVGRLKIEVLEWRHD